MMKMVFRFFGGVTALVIVGVVVAMTAFYLWLNSYLQSDDFRTMVSAETSRTLGLKGEYLPFHWAGLSVHSDGFYGRGADGGPLTVARADQINADLNLRPVFSGVWNLPHIDIQSLTVELKAVSTSTESPTAPVESETAPQATPAAPHPTGFMSRFLPTRVQIDSIGINSINMSFNPGPPVTLTDMQATLQPEGNTWNIEGSGGVLKHPDWPPFNIQRAKLRATRDQLFLTEVTLQLDEGGHIELSGDIDNRDSGPIHVLADVKGAPITAFLTGDWRARFVGNLNGKVNWTGDAHGSAPIQAVGTMRLLDGRIEALPFLNQIAQLTKTEDFRSLKLHKATADFIWVPQKNRLEVSHLVIESEGLARIEGKFTVENDMIDGHFLIGTVPVVLKYIPGAQTQVFTDSHDGYLWAPLNLTGPLKSPKDDLTPKLQAAAVNSIGETANQGLQNVIDAAKSLLPF